MFRKPTSKSRKPHGFTTVRKSFKERQNMLGVDSLAITIPREAVHPHNAQNVPFEVSMNIDKHFNPVFSADILGILRRIKYDEKVQKKSNFLRRTKWRASLEKEDIDEEIERLKRKFRAASYAGKCYDFGELFRKLDKDKNGTLDMEEFEKAVRKFIPTITCRQMRALLKAVDTDGNGEIDEKEFVDFIGFEERKDYRLSKRQALLLHECILRKLQGKVDDSSLGHDDHQPGLKQYVWDMSANPNQPPKGPPRIMPDANSDFAHEIRNDKAVFQIPVKVIHPVDLDGSTSAEGRSRKVPGFKMDEWWQEIMARRNKIENEAYNIQNTLISVQV